MYVITFENMKGGAIFTDLGHDLRDGRWAPLRDREGGPRGRMYIDGALAGESSTLKNVRNSAPFLLGCSNSRNHLQRTFWSGQLDEFMVYDRALSEEEVTTLWNAAPLATETPAKTGATIRQAAAEDRVPCGSPHPARVRRPRARSSRGR